MHLLFSLKRMKAIHFICTLLLLDQGCLTFKFLLPECPCCTLQQCDVGLFFFKELRTRQPVERQCTICAIIRRAGAVKWTCHVVADTMLQDRFYR